MVQAKTNAQRILEREKLLYIPHTYDASDGHIDGVAVAQKVGMPVEKVFKTLVTRAPTRNVYVFVIPAAQELNLKSAAKAVKEKSVEMVGVKELLPLTGYVRGGCSPIGMKKQYGTVIDSSALDLPTIVISAGKIGAQIELSAENLQKATGCVFESITAQKD